MDNVDNALAMNTGYINPVVKAIRGFNNSYAVCGVTSYKYRNEWDNINPNLLDYIGYRESCLDYIKEHPGTLLVEYLIDCINNV